MKELIASFTAQLRQAMDIGEKAVFSKSGKSFSNVLITGLGGSGIGGSIIAHEVAHGDLRHSTDQLTKQYGIQVLIALLTDSDSRLLADIGASLVQLSYSRSDETEADQFAVRYLKDTPYNPTAFADFFQRMLEKDGDTGMFQFLSTHPDPGNRVEKIKEEANAN